jgi:hypothetical protein
MTILTSGRIDPDTREWWQGWWQSTVCWLEVKDDDSEELVEVVKTFYSDAERTAHLEKRIQEGYIYDILWTSEVSLGGKGYPGSPTLGGAEWDKLMRGEIEYKTSPMVSEENIQVM